MLASKATKTIVWIGCVHARRERDWSTGVICLLSQFGFDELEVDSEVRNRAGRKDAPSIINVVNGLLESKGRKVV